MAEAKLAFIGGSGMNNVDGLTERESVDIETPFGAPSDSIVVGTLGETRVAFLPRHGRGHRLSPTDIPARANIYALKLLGVERLVSISAVGSLREEVEPQDFLVPDQLIDRTKSRAGSFFGEGLVAHVSFADPFCPVVSRLIAEEAHKRGIRTHSGGTYVVIEGPQFSTRAESELYRSWKASVVGMTAIPEAKLAREAEICYATMALVTDYDTWHDDEEDVSVELIVGNLLKSVAASQGVIAGIVPRIPVERDCGCSTALKDAIITSPDQISESIADRLSAIVSKYLKITGEVK
jgi:5'-methylthioadenosine phosphorylase